MTRNQIAYWDLNEKIRSNLANEAETHRANLAREAENYRSNVAREGIDISKLNETARQTDETIRSHKAQETISLRELQTNIQARQLELEELIRTHKANEALGWSNVAIQQSRAIAQNALDEARTVLAGNQDTRENILNVQQASKLRGEVEYLQKQIDLYGSGQARYWVDTIISALKAFN